MKIAYISDLHIDSYIKYIMNLQAVKENIIKDAEVGIPLIIAGDLSNDKSFALKLLGYLSQYYRPIYFVSGNHEYYFQKQTNNSLDYLVTEAEKQFGENFIYLDRQGIKEIGNKKIAGTNMWYNFYQPETEFAYLFKLNDSRFLTIDRAKEEAMKDIKYYNEVIDEVDIFVSHVPLIETPAVKKYKNDNCFRRTVDLRENKIYIAGHTHLIYKTQYENSKFYFNAFGYPNEIAESEKGIKIIEI